MASLRMRSPESMTTKIELLEKFSRERLAEVAREFNVPTSPSASAKEIVATLGKVRRPTKAELEVLAKSSSDESVKGAFIGEASEFYGRTAIRGFDHHNAILVHVARSIALAEIMMPGILETLEKHLEGQRGVKIPTKPEMPRHIAEKLSAKQWKGLKVARSFQWVWGEDGAEILRLARENPDLIGFGKLTAALLAEPGKRYLCLAWKSFAAEQYDASIVMLGRAVEFILKAWLKVQSPSGNFENLPLGGLLKEYERLRGTKDEVAKYVAEMEAFQRNLSAHDHRPEHTPGVNEANHVWTGAVVLLKQLLGVDVRLESIRLAE